MESTIRSHLEPLFIFWEKLKRTTVFALPLGQLISAPSADQGAVSRLRQIANLPNLGENQPNGLRLLRASAASIVSGKTNSLLAIRSLRDEE